MLGAALGRHSSAEFSSPELRTIRPLYPAQVWAVPRNNGKHQLALCMSAHSLFTPSLTLAVKANSR
jgi:hypothetical protein